MQINKKKQDGERVVTSTLTKKGMRRLMEFELKSISTGFRDNTLLSISPDNSLIACADWKHLKLYNLKVLEEITQLSFPNLISSIAFSPDSRTLALGFWEEIKLLDVSSLKRFCISFKITDSKYFEEVIQVHSHSVEALAYSPDSSLLAYGSGDTTLNLVNLETKKEVASLAGHSWKVNSLSFSPDGQILASTGCDRTVRIWDVNTLREIVALKDLPVISVQFSPDGQTLATSLEADRFTPGIKLWSVGDWKELKSFTGHIGTVWSISFSPNGSRLVSGSSDRTIKIWDVSNGEEVATLWGHLDSVRSVLYSPDGLTIASGGWTDKTVKLWSIL